MARTATRSNSKRPLLLRARVAFPITSPLIEDAGILIQGNRIERVAPWKALARTSSVDRVDLGDTLVMPGLVNAHCHLDYTHMTGMFPSPKSFTGWIQQMTVAKQTWSDAEFLDSWLAGAAMLLRTGTTTVADIEAIPTLLPHVWRATPLRVFSFLEMTGIRSRRDPHNILNETLKRIRRLPRGRSRAWLSPHAPYSTKPELLQLSAEASRHHRLPMTTHVAESEQEQEMFLKRRGEMFHWLQRNNRDMSDCGNVTPVEHMARSTALGPRVLAVHVNHLGKNDSSLLADTGTHVAHCPRSHLYFGHHAFPFRQLHRAGVNICLGTDSLASVNQPRQHPAELSLFAEMREFARHHPTVAPATILQMATINGARALGRGGKTGELTPGAYADLIGIPFQGSRRNAFRTAVTHNGHVTASMIHGRWAIQPERY